MQLTGGGGPNNTNQTFLKEALELHRSFEELGIPKKQTQEFFGLHIKDKNQVDQYRRYGITSTGHWFCSMQYSASEIKKVLHARDLLEKSESCVDLKDPENSPSLTLVNFAGNKGDREVNCSKSLSDVSPKNVPAPDSFRPKVASLEELSKALVTLSKKMGSSRSKEHHLILTLNDHGSEDQGKISMGAQPQADNPLDSAQISPSQMVGLVKKMKANLPSDVALTMNLNAQACYGGFWPDEFAKHPEFDGLVCTTAMQHREAAGYGADILIPETFDRYYPEKLGVYGNQLQAFACSTALDTANNPVSTLDSIIDGLDLAPTNNQPNCATCGPVANSFSNLITEVETDYLAFAKEIDRKINGDQSRKILYQSYKDLYLKAAQECRTQRTANRFYSKLSSCLKEDKFKKLLITRWGPDVADYLIPALSDIFERALAAADHELSMINSHIDFIKNAPPKQLERFQKAFCCMAYNYKTGRYPDLCSQTGIRQ
jgi:hypothetical protein